MTNYKDFLNEQLQNEDYKYGKIQMPYASMIDSVNGDQINYNYTMFCAGGVMVALPVTLLFMLLQKYYVEGVTGGAVKG